MFQPRGGRAAIAFADLDHGDMELDLEFMLEAGSCAAVLLQGRYEIRLCDSRLVSIPRSIDSGGILYTEASGRPGGVAPRLNAARAAGLWQRLSVDFRAPVFDPEGRKLSSARLERVVLNGATVHGRVELPGPSPNAPIAEDGPMGPLAFSGEQGSAAFRHLRYRLLGTGRVATEDVRYAYYEGDFATPTALEALEPAAEGVAGEISPTLAARGNRFALRFSGTLVVPRTGSYRFDAAARGDVTLMVAGEAVFPLGPAGSGTVRLAEGRHRFSLTYLKSRRGDPALSLYVEGPGIRRRPLTSPEAGWHSPPVPPIAVEPGDRPYILRNHVHHDGRKKTNGVFVGDPAGTHYALDLDLGALLFVWRGPFLNLGPVWTGRGMEPDSRQLDEPEIVGSRISMSGRPSFALLSHPGAAWPDNVDDDFRLAGYDLDDQGRPTFQYRLGQTIISDRFVPTHGKSLSRETVVRGAPGSVLWIRLAEGRSIERRSEGLYVVNEEYYIEVSGAPGAMLLRRSDRSELRVPVTLSADPARIESTIIW